MNEIWILLLLIAISALPVILVFCFFRLRRSATAPLSVTPPLFLAALAAGAVSLLVAALIQGLFPYSGAGSGGTFPVFYNVFFRIAFIEELSRIIVLVPLFAVLKRRRPLDASFCAALGLTAGLGFAMIESAFYGLADVNITLLRAFTAAPLHGACGIRVGAAIFFLTGSGENRYPVKALFLFVFAVLIHGAYNMIIANPALPSLLAVLVAFTALFSSLPFLKVEKNIGE